MGSAKRATVYFEPEIHRALRLKAAASDRSIADLVNEKIDRLEAGISGRFTELRAMNVCARSQPAPAAKRDRIYFPAGDPPSSTCQMSASVWSRTRKRVRSSRESPNFARTMPIPLPLLSPGRRWVGEIGDGFIFRRAIPFTAAFSTARLLSFPLRRAAAENA
jgi:hypothetical protein